MYPRIRFADSRPAGRPGSCVGGGDPQGLSSRRRRRATPCRGVAPARVERRSARKNKERCCAGRRWPSTSGRGRGARELPRSGTSEATSRHRHRRALLHHLRARLARSHSLLTSRSFILRPEGDARTVEGDKGGETARTSSGRLMTRVHGRGVSAPWPVPPMIPVAFHPAIALSIGRVARKGWNHVPPPCSPNALPPTARCRQPARGLRYRQG